MLATPNMPLQELVMQQQHLLRIIGQIQDDAYWQDDARNSYEHLLHSLMELTGSRYGFIRTVDKALEAPEQTLINISPEKGKEFFSCLQTVVQNKEPLINVLPDSMANSILALPVKFGNEVLSVIGLAGRAGGYNQDTITLLEPLLKLVGRIQQEEKQRKQQAELVRKADKQEEDWNSLMLTLDDIVMEMNEQKIFTNVWCRQDDLLFMPREIFLGKTILEALGEHAKEFDDLADIVLQTGIRQQKIYRDIRPEMEKWYSIKISLFENSVPGPKRLLILIRDVSNFESQKINLKRSQAELKRSNQLLNMCQDMSRMGGWEFNPHTGQIYWTAEIYKLREIPHTYPLSIQADAEFYHPADQAVYEAARDNLLYNYQPYDLELRHISAKGKQTWVRTVGQAILNTDGMVTHLRGIIMDITDKKDAELRLVKAMDDAQKAAQARSEFLSVMSHEIRTPLNAIIGFSGILNNGPTDVQPEIIQNLQFSARHLLGLINDILDFTKMEAGKIELEHIAFNPADLIQGIARNQQPTAKSKGLKLYTSFDDTIPENVIGDPVRLGQIINNLLDNAIKFTSQGYVSIEVQQETCSHPDSCTLSFTIKDTGIGISEEMQERIFESFVQENSAISRLHGGTGLGLAITRKLVELFNSRIILESKKDEGTTFRFDITFRVPPAKSAIQQKNKTPRHQLLKDKKILIIEDNAINIRILELQLQATGALISSVSNGKIALEKMKEELFDGVILDLHMPEMNGYETIPHIKAYQPDAFIIVLTADIMPEVSKRLSALGVNNLLPKPYAAEDLMQMLQRNIV